MRIVTLSILLAASAAISLSADAQTAAGDPRGEQKLTWGVPGPEISRLELGVRALKAGEFARAEEIFVEIARREESGYSAFYMSTANRANRKRDDGEANFYLGVARMNLGKWQEAKGPLEIAAEKQPMHPDPKSRLGVTYAKLGDIAGANAQRADLVKMEGACKDACELSPFILDGIRMIDEAVAKAASSS
jgi:uncharacterized protein HemY